MFRCLKPLGLSLPCLKRQRETANELLGNNLISESPNFFFPTKIGGVEARAAPYVYVQDLTQKVFDLIDDNDRYVYTYNYV